MAAVSEAGFRWTRATLILRRVPFSAVNMRAQDTLRVRWTVSF